MNTLLAQHCRPLEGQPAMSAAEIRQHLAEVPGWALVDGAIEKRFQFRDDLQALAFVSALGWLAHREDHHPDLHLLYDRCTVRFNTHSVGGISINDFICAAKTDALQA